MTKRDNILQELQELNSSLADAGLQNVYMAPAGYFDSLAHDILKRIRALESTNAEEELKNLSPFLSSISKQMPHSVPAGYFEAFEKKLVQTVSSVDVGDQSAQEELETLSPLLSSLKKKKTYSVPAGYFDAFEKKLEQPISTVNNNDLSAQEELESLSLLLSELKKKEIYTVPVGYFENLKPSIDIANALPPVNVISITSRKWFRYAAAAIVIGFVATVGLLFFNNTESIDPADKSYSWVKKNLKKVSTDEINEFVELANAGTADVVKSDAKVEINNLLKDVSDKEIQDFLNDTQTSEAETGDELILN